MSSELPIVPLINQHQGIKQYDSRPSTMIFVEYQPGNGTRYPVLFTYLGTLEKLSQDRIGCQPESWLVTMLTCSPYNSLMCSTNDHVHWSYVMEKLQLNQTDALCVAELIKLILHTQ